MKAKILVGVLLFLIAVNIATLGTYLYQRFTDGQGQSFPFGPPEERPGPPFGRQEHPMMQLAPEQREKMMELMSGFREETSELRQEIMKLESTTFELLQGDAVPVEKVDNNLRRLSELRLAMSRKATQNLIKAKAFLSPEQQRMFYGAITQARPGMGPMGPGLGGRRGPAFRGLDSVR